MRSNYKKLGQYIRQVNIRNTELEVDRLLGVSIKKVLMPSIANTVGTNMKTYKIIRKGQFAYGAVTSRNGDKISIALLEEYDEAIVSQAYTVFEVKDNSKLLPEYLMMWFRRPEFDRYARFKSHGSARETFDWEEMLETELPVPNIEKQREIVAEYNTVVDRIKLNEELNKKLEETAQTLYKHWFVDFEFPAYLSGTLSGVEGYKSSGGEMVYNSELDKEIPKGWGVIELGKIIESHSTKHKFDKDELIFFNTSDILDGEFLHKDYTKVSGMPGQAKKSIRINDILYSEIRPANKRYALVREEGNDYVVSTKLMVLRITDSKYSHFRIYHYLIAPKTLEVLQQAAEGRSGTFPQITFDEHLQKHCLIVGTSEIEEKWLVILEAYFNQLYSRKDEIRRLKEINKIIMSKMTKV